MLTLILQPKQMELAKLVMASGPKAATWIGYGGARGGGKSGAARRVMIQRRFKYPNTTGFIVRRNFGDLYENHVVKFAFDFPELAEYYHSGLKEYRLPNGSRIVLKYADTLDEVRSLAHGPECMDLFVDQAEEFSGEELQILHTCNRWPGAGVGGSKTILAFNPGGIGTEFLRRVFWTHEYHNEEKASDYAFIQAYGWDNYEWFRGEISIRERDFYALDPDTRFELFVKSTSYGRTLNALPESLRVGELLGSFESFSGQYFAGVWDEKRVVLTRVQIEGLVQPWWTRWMATDWGFAHYAVNLWLTSGKVSPRSLESIGVESDFPLDLVICYRELVCNETPEPELAQRIVDMTPEAERKQIQRHFLSPDAWAKRGQANPVWEQLQPVLHRGGLPSLEQADNDRVGGYRLLYDGFRRARALRSGTGTRDHLSVEPALFISSECAQVIASVPLLVRDPKKLEDVLKVPGPAYDDVGDCLRYAYKTMLDAKPKAPVEIRAKELWDSIKHEDPSTLMTNRNLAMLKFQQDEARVRRIGRKIWR